MAEKVFTVSHWSKDDLVATYGLPEDKISVTYNAPQKNFRRELPATKALISVQWAH